MLFQYSSLLMALAVGCGAMSLTLLVSWMATRRDGFLLIWALSTLVLVGATATFALYAADETSISNFVPCLLLTTGLSICWSAARVFRLQVWKPRLPIAFGVIIAIVEGGLAVAGLDGTMFILANAGAATLLVLCAWEYWEARSETLELLAVVSFLYVFVAFSFAACGVMIALDTPLHLDGAPQNWAETLNALASIIGVTCIGAISLTLNQQRVARDHRIEARTDALTGLLNRRALEDLFNDNRPGRAAAVIVFDLDHFKRLNDNFGHALGDRVLRHFTAICKDCLRKGDIAARIGGEEFAVILKDGDPDIALKVAERIRARFAAESVEWESLQIPCTVSAGVYGMNSGGSQTLEAMLRRADEALYQAKNNGRNQVSMEMAVA